MGSLTAQAALAAPAAVLALAAAPAYSQSGAAPSLVSASGAALSADGSTVTYTPPRNFHGAGGFSYTAADEHGIDATAEVAVSVSPVNDPPEARDLRVTVREDSFGTIRLSSGASDPDGDALSISISQPPHGEVSARGSSYRYYPDTDYNGPDSFTYTVRDPSGLSDRGTVFITVTPMNDRPVLADRETEVTALQDTPLEIELREHDIDGDRIKFVELIDPDNGRTDGLPTDLVGSGEAAIVTYTPEDGFQGTDRFTYRAEDEHGRQSAVSGSVTITVTSADYVYVANTDRSRVEAYLGGEHLGTLVDYRRERQSGVGGFFDLAFGRDDTLYVADFGEAKAIRRFDSSGSPVPRPGGSLGLLATTHGAPTAIAVDTSGNSDVLYVATLKGLERIDTAERRPSVERLSIVERVRQDDEVAFERTLLSPHGVAVCGDTVYVSDRMLNRILGFSKNIEGISNPSANPPTSFALNTGGINIRSATGLTCGADANVLYQSGERPASRVNKIDLRSSSLLETFTSELRRPYGLDEESGTLYVADESHEWIAVFGRDPVTTFGRHELSDPRGVEVGPKYAPAASGQAEADLGPGNDDPDFSVVGADGLPAGNVTVSWGQPARLTVLASDPEGDPITIGIDSGTTPPGAVTVDDGGDGTAAVTVARPDGAEAALHVFYVTVTDGHSYPDYEPYLVIFED